MLYLSDRDQSRDNNLNLIRALAASAVLVSHAYPIALGPDTPQPMKELTGHSLGTLSVYAFFGISGFLISMSFMRTSSWQSFLTARFLRLMPGLIVSMAVVALLLGPIWTTQPVGTYLTTPQTWLFIVQNSSLVFLEYTLPGVFSTHPYPTVEGSIWTLFYEVVCYMGVFALGLAGVLGRRLWMSKGLLAYLAVWLLIEVNGSPYTRLTSLQDLSLPFVIGMMFYQWRERLPLSLWGIAILAILAWVTRTTAVYDIALVTALCYGIFWAGYVPGGPIRAFNRLGDYSYGIYIYAFPMQGAAVWLMGGGVQDPLVNMALAFPPTLILSVLSWHLIEGPAMTTKRAIVARLRQT